MGIFMPLPCKCLRVLINAAQIEILSYKFNNSFYTENYPGRRHKEDLKEQEAKAWEFFEE